MALNGQTLGGKSTAAESLRDFQVESLVSLLNLNQGNQRENTLPSWKVLVLDTRAQDVLATTLRVQDLRDQGVTLHLPLHSDRPAIPDVPAVYFCAPTSLNMQRIAEVCTLLLQFLPQQNLQRWGRI